MLFGLRFDLRNPAMAGVTTRERYAAALDMARWADEHGCVSIALSEHHGGDDGYLPSPIVMAAAMATVTTNVRFMIAALVAPFYDTVRLAEDLVVLDNLSGGRVDVIVAGGYVPGEFEMFGADPKARGAKVEETVSVLQAAFAGEPIPIEGRSGRVTPLPDRPGGPGISIGGTARVAARRAARLGLGFMPSTPEAWQHYRDAVIEAGRPDPGPSMIGEQVVLTLADDLETGWAELGPYLMHDSNEYGRYQREADIPSLFHEVGSVDELRARKSHRIATPAELVAELKDSPFPFAMFHPMCGGIPPELAWQSLRLLETDVMPNC